MENNEKKVSAEVTENTEKKEKKPMSKKKKTLVIILCILLAFLLFIGGFAIWYVNDKLNKIDYESPEQTTIAPNQDFIQDEDISFDEIGDAVGNDFKEILKNWATNDGEKISKPHVLNVLLIGSDASSEETGRASITDKGNTDVMMLVSVDKENKKITLTSFMRDSYTYMDQFDSYGKLNAACANGGAPYLVETIENDYKIEIDGYVLVDFDSFKAVIDVVGGVNVDVPQYVATFLGHGFPSGDNILLNGEQALRFSRVRKSDKNGDISRVARQRQVVNALIDKCINASLSDINEVFDVILANVRTNIPKKEILSYATKAVTEGWATYEISELTMPTEDARRSYNSRSTAWIWVVDYPLVAQKLQMELYGETNINLSEDRITALDVIK